MNDLINKCFNCEKRASRYVSGLYECKKCENYVFYDKEENKWINQFTQICSLYGCGKNACIYDGDNHQSNKSEALYPSLLFCSYECADFFTDIHSGKTNPCYELNDKTIKELITIFKIKKIQGYSKKRKGELIKLLTTNLNFYEFKYIKKLAERKKIKDFINKTKEELIDLLKDKVTHRDFPIYNF